MTIEQHITKFELDNNAKVVYLTKSGSTLYGTNTPSSDLDYKGIFIPSERDTLLKQDLPFYSYSSGANDSKNTSEDIDIHLDSIHTFFKLLQKGEIGTIDLLFSMYREDTQVIAHPDFINKIKEYKNSLYGKNLHAFVGYSISQAKKSGIKGTRYGELKRLIRILTTCTYAHDTLEENSHIVKLQIRGASLKYIKFVHALGPRSNHKVEDVEFLEVLGKKYVVKGTSMDQLLGKLTATEASYSSRVKAVTDNVVSVQTMEGVLYKSLSHSVRVISEVIELLETNHIVFPLANAKHLLDIKQGKVDHKEVLNYIEDSITKVYNLMTTSSVQDKADKATADILYLYLLCN